MNPSAFRINYPMHPGFAGLVERPPVQSPRCEELFVEIDREFESLSSTGEVLGADRIHREFSKSILPRIEEIKSIVRETMAEGDLFRPSALTALDRLGTSLRKEIDLRDQQKTFRTRKVGASARKISEDLRSDGISLLRVPADHIARVWEHLAEHRKALEEQREHRPKTMASCVRSLPLKGSYWDLIVREMRELGILEAVEHFSRAKMNLDYCALHLAHEHEDWYRECYSDVGLGTQKTTYMHYDQDYALLKMMIYLRDFNESIGDLAPFSIVKGRHWMGGSYSRSAFYKELDFANGEVIDPNDRSATTYYRPVFKYPKYRKEFLKLPIPLQGSSHFGDDIVDGSELSRDLLGSETRMTMELANCAIFHGGHHIHRGGMVETGERWALQVGFRLADPSMKARLKRIRQKAGLHAPAFLKTIYRAFRTGRG